MRFIPMSEGPDSVFYSLHLKTNINRVFKVTIHKVGVSTSPAG